MKSFQFCNNCGKNGHVFQNCKKPIISSGIISYTYFENTIKYLLICRKNSLGFVDFIRGKYNLTNISHISNLIDEMTINEKNLLLTKDFDDLWYYVWGDYVGNQYSNEEYNSKEKFNKLKLGLINNITLKFLIEQSKTNWVEPEWGFPKGRRNSGENDIQCAIREYREDGPQNLKRHVIKIRDGIYTGKQLEKYLNINVFSAPAPGSRVRRYRRINENTICCWRSCQSN